ncbi:hypothetical protein P5V15_015628 [Pogonomyrmex californicus]
MSSVVARSTTNNKIITNNKSSPHDNKIRSHESRTVFRKTIQMCNHRNCGQSFERPQKCITREHCEKAYQQIPKLGDQIERNID